MARGRKLGYDRPPVELFIKCWNACHTRNGVLKQLKKEGYDLTAAQLSNCRQYYCKESPEWAEKLPPFRRGRTLGKATSKDAIRFASEQLEKDKSSLRSHMKVMDMTDHGFSMSSEGKLRDLTSTYEAMMSDYTHPALQKMLTDEYHRQESMIVDDN